MRQRQQHQRVVTTKGFNQWRMYVSIVITADWWQQDPYKHFAIPSLPSLQRLKEIDWLILHNVRLQRLSSQWLKSHTNINRTVRSNYRRPVRLQFAAKEWNDIKQYQQIYDGSRPFKMSLMWWYHGMESHFKNIGRAGIMILANVVPELLSIVNGDDGMLNITPKTALHSIHPFQFNIVI